MQDDREHRKMYHGNQICTCYIKNKPLPLSDGKPKPRPPRPPRGGKKMKKGDEAKERPPWRVVSVSTLPKADKSAILRAKLLDASRRMRANRTTVSCQTDNIPTKLMKEVNIDIQVDLISRCDKEILTDGAITLRQEGPGEFVLTHSVAQMTEGVRVNEAHTQTATPRTSSRFFDEYYQRNIDIPKGEALNDNLSKSERKLIEQIKAIRKLDEKLIKNHDGEENDGNNNNNEEKSSKTAEDSDLSDDSLFDNGNGPFPTTKFLKKRSYKKPKHFLKPTLPSWNFDFSDEDENSLPNFPRRPYSEGTPPWNNFKDMVIGNKLANMKLSPIPPRRASLKKKSVTWSDAQHNAVADLINEANALLDVFDQMSLILGPDIQLNKLPDKEDTEIKFLSEHWEPILKQSNQVLEQKLKTLKNPTINKVRPLSPDILEKIA